ncbi:PXDN [Mytilus edulis]|uniref:PXDN n=1 Tax=Mytilus edulis TaxID=6550 RepID=A0A8S3V0V6_MYTED|nr:PXDN [Mytilus edulis]
MATQRVLFNVQRGKCDHFAEKKIFLNFTESNTFFDISNEIHPMSNIDEKKYTTQILCSATGKNDWTEIDDNNTTVGTMQSFGIKFIKFSCQTLLQNEPDINPSETDGISDDLPRTHCKNGDKLKSARLISNTVLSTKQNERSPKSTRHTLTLVHFAQFVDHDVVKTPSTKIRDKLSNDPYAEIKVEDCNEHCVTPKEHCFPIEVPDNNFKSDCMHFVRNKPAPGEDCMPSSYFLP